MTRMLAMLICLATAEAAPKLQFDETEFDFGKATEGDAVAGKFSFRNAGDAVLNIDKLDPSCGCTDAKVNPNTLQPGERGEITFTVDLTNARGPVTKAITVPSNDPDQPKLKLIIKGDVKAVYEYDPQMVLFDDVAPGTNASEVVEVKRLDGKKLRITKAEAGKPFLSTHVEPATNAAGDEARVVVQAKHTGKPEQFSDML